MTVELRITGFCNGDGGVVSVP